MHNYVQPTLREKPDHIVIHFGTNDLAPNLITEKIAQSFVDQASTLKADLCSVLSPR